MGDAPCRTGMTQLPILMVCGLTSLPPEFNLRDLAAAAAAAPDPSKSLLLLGRAALLGFKTVIPTPLGFPVVVAAALVDLLRGCGVGVVTMVEV